MLAVLGGVASEALNLTGFYYSGKPLVTKRKAVQLSRTSTGRYYFTVFNYYVVDFHIVRPFQPSIPSFLCG